MKKRRVKRSKQARPVVHKKTNEQRVSENDYAHIRSSILMGAGIVATAFTLLGGLQTVAELADWCRYLVDNWKNLTELFWQAPFSLFEMKLYPEAASALTFYFSLMAIAASARVLQSGGGHAKDLKNSVWDITLEMPLTLAVAVWSMFIFVLLQKHLVFNHSHSDGVDFARLCWLLALSSIGGATVLFWRPWRELIDNVVLAVFVGVFFFIVALPSAFAAKEFGGEEERVYKKIMMGVCFGLFPIQVMSLLTWAKARFIIYRFVVVATVVIGVLLLSWWSRAGLRVTAPA